MALGCQTWYLGSGKLDKNIGNFCTHLEQWMDSSFLCVHLAKHHTNTGTSILLTLKLGQCWLPDNDFVGHTIDSQC